MNAGHNPPILLKSNGKIELLTEGGLILGSIPGMPYEQGTVVLEHGDLLLLYTDGVSEAMNTTEEEFGEERITEFMRTNRNLNPQEILEKLEAEVVRYRGSAYFEDDFTLVLAKAE